ncbi:MAG: LPS-assembly protein LptD [Muribaculaceae bacterium]|nr:LPS-assembly protein LptD [Muribaculaceae bacterium]
MRRYLIYIFITVIAAGLALADTLGSPASARSQNYEAAEGVDTAMAADIFRTDSLVKGDSVSLPDSMLISGFMPDTLELDTADSHLEVMLDSLEAGRNRMSKINRDASDISEPVTFSANDSMLLIGRNNAFLFGNGEVEYGQFKLNSDNIAMNLEESTVRAEGRRDSVGELVGNPVFKDKGGEYESETMSYNFKTEKGYITNIITQQGEGYLTGGATKKNQDGTYFLENGRYTTCDDHEHPHFYFNITKGKLRPGKDVVTGPAYMVLADVPLPLALPFGYFPFSKSYSSGIIFPSFGDDYNRGFYLRNGGYYFAINDYVDLALTGELYTKGSWGLTGRSTYVKRYRFRGNFNISYLTTITGDKGAPDYSKQTNFQVVWTHTQDAKANPNLSFSASVNFTTSGYTRNDLNSYYSSAFTENTKSSTVSLSYRFPGTKWSIAATANIAQRTQDSTLAVSFPNINVSLSQLAPFKRKVSVGGERWYEKIRLSYTGQFQNSLTAKQNQFFQKSLIKDWRNGMRHSLPISATFSLFKYINISPSISINDRMYTSKIKRSWDPNAYAEVADTTYGFYNVFDFSASVSLDTKLYGFWKPMKFLGDKVQMIRHVLTPTVSFSWAPDFGAPGWGYYGSYSYTDRNGQEVTRDYGYFQHGIFGAPSRGKTGIVSVNLANNLEMKVKSDADSTGVKKISLIENFSIGQSYNFAADSLNWSNLTTSIMLRLVKNFNLSLQASWDPYTYQLNSAGNPVRVNVPRWKAGKGWVKLSSTGTSFSYTFNNDTFRKKKKNETPDDLDLIDGEEDIGAFPDGVQPESDDFAARAEQRRQRRRQNLDNDADADGYSKWECPWSLTLNYSVNYGYGAFDYDNMDYRGKFTQNLSISGSIRPTKNWNFTMSASYNFDLKKIAYMNCSITRDLHCFVMTASFVPVGPYKSYTFHIAVKSSLLKDLKYDKRSSTSNGIRWY